MCPNVFDVSTDEVELLVVFDEDFERVLRPVMEKQWMEKKSALMALDYFKFFSRDQIINACKLCILRQFEPLETIYYEDKGQLSYVHFVLSGECMILQCLEMMVTQRKGKKTFELVQLSKEIAVRLFQGLSNAELLKILRNESNPTVRGAYDIDQLIESVDDFNESKSKAQSRDVRKADVKSIEIKCGLLAPDSVSVSNSTSNTSYYETRGEKRISLNDDSLVENEYNDLRELSDETEIVQYEELEGGDEDLEDKDTDVKSKSDTEMSFKFSQQRLNESKERLEAKEKFKKHKSKNKKNIQAADYPSSADKRNRSLKPEGKFTGDKRESKLDRKRSTLNALRQSIRSSVRNSISCGTSALPTAQHESSKLENRFIDVGSLTFGGIFGLGEKLEHRVIMARTAVQCLMIPRFWLFEKDQNPGNIWQRRRFYLDTTIPSRETLFNDFLSTRQWQKFKDDLVQSHLNPNSISNPTKIQDIPIICRLVEANDD